MCLHLLTSSAVSEDLVPVVVEIMVRVVPDVEDRLQALAEAISEVREPMTEQEQPEPDPSTCLSAGEARQRELKVSLLCWLSSALPYKNCKWLFLSLNVSSKLL